MPTEPRAGYGRTSRCWYAAYVVASRVNNITDGLQGWLFRRHVAAEWRRRSRRACLHSGDWNSLPVSASNPIPAHWCAECGEQVTFPQEASRG